MHDHPTPAVLNNCSLLEVGGLPALLPITVNIFRGQEDSAGGTVI